MTVLHLADTQFGRYHDFERKGLTRADRDHDRLAARLLDDLDRLCGGRGAVPVPDLVVVAGDLAEWALPEEYAAVAAFLADLRRGLDLGPERLVLVPGNHDVNRKLSHAYVLREEGYGRLPQRPFWEKWAPYATMYREVTGRDFTEARPWSLVELPELGVAVAALNSTMAESHLDADHHGWLGEEQLRWFTRALAPARQAGWLRLGVVHHNPVRGADVDDAHLKDVGRFTDLLGPSLHLVLHGHTHDARIHHLGPEALPVLAGGSAAVMASERPPGTPNQYQIVTIDDGGIQIFARGYEPARSRWVGDTSISADGDDWRRRIKR